MNKAQLATLLTVVITIIIISVSLLIPVPSKNNPFDFYFNLITTEATTLFSIGASVVIVLGFGAFTSQFRRAYTFLFTGLIIWGVSYLQLPLLVGIGKINNPIFLGATTIPFIGSTPLIFAGTRMLANLFNVKTTSTKWWFAFGVAFVVCSLVVLMPHAYVTTGELEYDSLNVLIMLPATFFAICAYHILLIKRQASVTFTNAFAWLCLSMLITAFVAGFGSTASSMILGENLLELTNILAFAPSLLGAVLFLRSAYSFNQIAESKDVQGQFVARDFFGHPLHPKISNSISSIDIVTYTAMLVSTPAAINNILDTVRFITAKLPPNLPPVLSPADEESLKDVYLKIEQYLLTQETIRKFTKEMLRQDIAQKLNLTAAIATNTFWNKLT